MNYELIKGDCIEQMEAMKLETFDLTVTSPPYDNLRTYEGSLQWNEEIWKQVLEQLYRVTRQGGVVVWVVGDATVRGSETGTSFKQALYAKEVGFNLHDTMIWHKNNPMPTQHTRYENSFEYMFVFAKGKIKRTEILREPTQQNGVVRKKHRAKGGDKDAPNDEGFYTTNSTKIRHNVWNVPIGTVRGLKHSAPFPEQLVTDHIKSWSNEGDVVFDPFMGSGTTGRMALRLNRRFVGVEKVDEYYAIAKERIEKRETSDQMSLKLT